MKDMNSRRDFLKKAATGTAAVTIGGVLPGFSARSYNRIAGSNGMVRISVMGVNSRGRALAVNFAKQQNCEVRHICDVDSRATESW
jgi:NADH/NAD ratio-sensing transcriptional regulator Rex